MTTDELIAKLNEACALMREVQSNLTDSQDNVIEADGKIEYCIEDLDDAIHLLRGPQP